MKNLIRIFLIISACIMLSGCSDIGTFEDSNVDNETLPTVEENRIEDDMPDADLFDAIFYNGECYYGLAMTQDIKEGEEPEGFTYLGKISSVKEKYKSPTEELETTIYEVGEDVYYYVDEEGCHNFCIPTDRGYMGIKMYKGIYHATKRKPAYYDE